ncbi:outer membrane beta-barrel protein [Flavobacterium sp. F52]|uniref:outer membrane beta-barrel protein n=1 Tax=Flavobacterium sp. F52 TaxID=1202532 RepID=UPI000272F333|nr:outer membrane beta-barrel protein [Flavobacterium sp. F52]EJG00319.1 hypothetical protein FF52_15662 [Flavobacterium sp. F52]
MKKIIASLMLLGTISLSAQNSVVNVAWSLGFSTGDLSDYISDVSARGFSLSYARFVKPELTVGFSTGWNVFHSSLAYDTYTEGTSSLSGKQWRTNNAIPILANANYYFKKSDKINSYAGMGIGMVYNRRNTDMYIYTLEEESWNFALQPEIGLEYKIDSKVALTAAGKYYYCFESGEIPCPTSYFALNIGVSFLGW